jgi:hypothetical protein
VIDRRTSVAAASTDTKAELRGAAERLASSAQYRGLARIQADPRAYRGWVVPSWANRASGVMLRNMHLMSTLAARQIDRLHAPVGRQG